jgi:adenylylsulfate kinase-like enzyme
MIILLRGNSGSGKSSTAKLLREELHKHRPKRRVAIVEQDYLRRNVLKEKETEGTNNIELIAQTVRYALKKDYVVILEGIFYSKRYGAMLRQLLKESKSSRVYYFDVSLEETLRRHLSKINAHEFGEAEMRSWYHAHDVLDVDDETILSEDLSQQQIIKKITDDARLL